MLPLEHFAIFLTCIKRQLVLKTNFRSFCEWPFLTGFHILVLQEYWVMTESRILLKPVLGSVRIVALSVRSHEQTQ